MRRHLFKLLKEKKLTMFPVLKKKQSVRVTEGNPILVYCSCRMPEVGDMVKSGFMYQVVPPLHKQH